MPGTRIPHVQSCGSPSAPLFPRPFWYGVLGCLAAAIALYLVTCAPDVTYTDSGELAACCVVWGVAHPTGYPLFTLLGRLWVTLLPFVPPIDALNALAALWTAFSAAAFFGLCWELLSLTEKLEEPVQQAAVCAITTLTYASARTVWEQGTALEVYSLHLLLLWLAMWAALVAWRTGSLRWLLFGAYIVGLGLAHHAMTVLLLPAVAWLFVPMFRQRGRQPLGLLFGAALLPLLLYVTLPLRSAAEPPLDWGGVARSLDKFLYHVTGRQYQVWMLADSTTWQKNAELFVHLLPWQLGVVGFPIVALGIWRLWRQSRYLLGWLVVLIGGCLLYAFSYSIHDIAPYFLQAYGGLLLALAVGFAFLWKRLPRVHWLLGAIPIVNLAGNWQVNDRSGDHTVAAYVQLIGQIAQPNALIISSQWDFWCSAFWYKQVVEGFRPDIALVEQELVRRTWYLRQLQRWYPEAMRCCLDALRLYEHQLEPFEAGQLYDAIHLQRAYENFFNSLIAAHIQTRPVYLSPDILVREPAIGAAYAKVPEILLLRLHPTPDTLSGSLQRLDFTKLAQSLRRQRSSLDRELREAVVRGIRTSLSYARQHGQLGVAKHLEDHLNALGATAP
ncbi:MAG: DUF2723 domain-containing protein [Chlorobiota bacterium]